MYRCFTFKEKVRPVILLVIAILMGLYVPAQSMAQDAPLANTTNSPYAKLRGVPMQDVHWTTGFWADWFRVCKDSMVPNMWQLFNNDTLSHGYKNFKIAAGLDTGIHIGPPFMDGDFLKWLEGAAAVYVHTKDPALDKMMDDIISVIAKAQRKDGYLGTQVEITQMHKPDSMQVFGDTLSFEAYNLGHLMTTACVHYRATGKKTLLRVAEKAADFLEDYYSHSSPTLARSAICPAHYMGVIELYRTTKKQSYLRLAEKLMDLRDAVINGTDQNQDRIPFRKQTTAEGHAVRANYLYAGAADVFMETGDSSLLRPLLPIWEDVVYRKMYITGGCGALYDGVSPDGTSYSPDEIQQVHQSYGRPYQLPNFTAHDETCANIGNMLWNWRMLQITGNDKYADILERTLYNSILSGISLNGKTFLYANPLAYNHLLPFQLRWSEKPRDPYIGFSFCCPPNVVRTIAEVSDYMYNFVDGGLYLHLYGGNSLKTTTPAGQPIELKEQTTYPWDGHIEIQLDKMPNEAYSLYLRIPAWCKTATLKINGQPANVIATAGSYVKLERVWVKGDKVSLDLPMEVTLMQANPLVEETRGQVAIERGPLIYCLESKDLPKGISIDQVAVDTHSEWQPERMELDGQTIWTLNTLAKAVPATNWARDLYQPIAVDAESGRRLGAKHIQLKLIPYYCWENRGRADMSVWLPLAHE